MTSTYIFIDSKTQQQYLKGDILGKGGFARCYKFTRIGSQNEFAGKTVEKKSLRKERAKQKLLSEIKIHRSLTVSSIFSFLLFFLTVFPFSYGIAKCKSTVYSINML